MWWNKIKLQESKSCKYPREECNADSMKALVKPEFQYIKHKILKSYSSAKLTYCYQPQSQKVYSKSVYIFLFYKSDYPVILSLLRDGV